MKTESDFYKKIEELESQGDYKETFKIGLKYSQSTNKVLTNVATRYLSTFDVYKHMAINKQIKYMVETIQLASNSTFKAIAIYNLAICYRLQGDWGAYKHFLEKALVLDGTSGALNLAKLYNICDKEKSRVKRLLNLLIKSQCVSEASEEEAKKLLDDIKNNKNNDYEYLLANTSYNKNKLPLKEPVIITEELESFLLEAITNYELCDYKKSFTQLKKLANTYRMSTAMLYLGDCYLDGKGTLVDIDKASLYYYEAKKTHQLEAILRLANFYKVIGEISLYKYYLEEARLLGSEKATLFLAELYSIFPKEKTMVKELLNEILIKNTATMDTIYGAEVLLKRLK